MMAEHLKVYLEVKTMGWTTPANSGLPPAFEYDVRWRLRHPRSLEGVDKDNLFERRIQRRAAIYDKEWMRGDWFVDKLVEELVWAFSKKIMDHVTQVEDFESRFWSAEKRPSNGSLMVDDEDGYHRIITFDEVYIAPVVNGEERKSVHVCDAVVQHWTEDEEGTPPFSEFVDHDVAWSLEVA